MAANTSNAEIVELLLESGADVNAVNEQDRTPPHYAAGKGHWKVAQALLARNADKNIAEVNGCTVLDFARANRRQRPTSFAWGKHNEGNVGSMNYG